MEHEPLIVRESFLSRIRPLYDSNMIKAILGPRRAGKSVAVSMIRDDIDADAEHKIYVDFEDMDNEPLTDPAALHDYLKKIMKDGSRYYIFLDEIQHVKSFEKVISSIRNKFDCSIFITGNNSRMLSGELSTLLTGREMTFEMLPFSYSEAGRYLEALGKPIPDRFLEDYIRCGGFPQRLQMPSDGLARKFLNELYDAILEKDIKRRHKRLDMKKFRKVSAFVLANCGNDFSSKSISDYLIAEGREVSSQTVETYVDIMEEAYLIKRVPQYDISGKRVMDSKPKNYALDNGMRYIMTNSVDIQGGFFLENMVYLELLGRGYEVYVGKKKSGGGIDFVAVKDGKKCFIQVAYLLATEETVKREFGAYGNVKDASPKYVMSMDTIDMSRDGIVHMNIEDFLLGKMDLYLT